MSKARPGAAAALPTPPAAPSHWQGLRQRFDTLALRPPDASPDDAALARRDTACRTALLAWCGQGAGPGGAPFWQSGVLPRVDLRLAVGALRVVADAHAAGDLAASDAGQRPLAAGASAWVDHLARQLDGSLHLAALRGRSAGLAYRLGVKRHDAMWWRPRQAHDPWDAGWALNTPAALQQLQTRFWPRRATLVLADAAAIDRLAPCLAALDRRQAGFRHPIRWLWVGAMADNHAPNPTGRTTAAFQLR